MSDPFDTEELWFARLLATVPTPDSLDIAPRHSGAPARLRRGLRPLVVAAGLVTVVAVIAAGLGVSRGVTHTGAPVADPSAQPAPRSQPGLAGDDIHQVVVLFGGRAADGAVLGDTWIWDGRGWSQRHPLHTPGPRREPAMSSDPGGGGVLLVGGRGAQNEVLADSWEWDGSDWQLLFPSSPPGPRAGAGLVQDPVEGHVVLFGGQGAPDARGSTWTWNGRTWIQESTPTAPPNCAGASMAFDDALRRVVLVTGRGCAAPGASGATWTWDGSAWSMLRLGVSPPAADGGSLAYYDSGQALVLVAPQAATGCGLLTWTWDGSTWTPHPGSTSSPGPGGVVRDPASRRPLLLAASGESWLWNGAWTVAAGSPPTGGGCDRPGATAP